MITVNHQHYRLHHHHDHQSVSIVVNHIFIISSLHHYYHSICAITINASVVVIIVRYYALDSVKLQYDDQVSAFPFPYRFAILITDLEIELIYLFVYIMVHCIRYCVVVWFSQEFVKYDRKASVKAEFDSFFVDFRINRHLIGASIHRKRKMEKRTNPDRGNSILFHPNVCVCFSSKALLYFVMEAASKRI